MNEGLGLTELPLRPGSGVVISLMFLLQLNIIAYLWLELNDSDLVVGRHFGNCLRRGR